ncbi:ATP-binding protein [Asanoa hainanensis]|uniref:ATP-binding protein n=1 Tax=Asanoa hainanensis TaxID=560556 RepID=UPI0024831DB2|nr:helix-turn-helix transcriptional regulator [Asanoa hainanensis]
MGGSDLVERAPQLAVLNAVLDAVTAGHGGVLVLLGGEAGGGKTALVREFCRHHAPVLWGACDPLFTPRPLGPFTDIAHDTGGALRELIAAGAKPHQVAVEVGRQAKGIMVLEDLHWADEATLDVLSLLGRRIGSLPMLVIATYRDDELHRTHPLRRLLGEVRGTRLAAGPLSVDAVAGLARPFGRDPHELHRATAGNPFFVTEVLAARGDDIPATVRDAVLARAARLDAEATTVVEAVSVAVPQCELDLLDALVDGAAAQDGLERALAAGIVEVAPGGKIRFRHELARRTIEESLSPHRRVALHRRALRAIPAGDATRLAHHAEAAGDAEAVQRFAPRAAEQAAAIGSHREAAAHYARALRFGAGLPPETRADLLERQSQECYLTDQTDESITALELAIKVWQEAGDRRAEAAAVSQLTRRLWCAARTEEATRRGDEAVRILEGLPPGRELALAYSNLSQLFLNDERRPETVAWARRAIDLAETLDDNAVIVHALNNIGTIELLNGDRQGLAKLERSRAMSERPGFEEHIGRVFIHVGWAMTRTRAYDLAPWLDRGIELCDELGLEGWRLYVQAYRARFHLDQGRWDAAADDAAFVLRSAESVPLLRILALTTIGTIRARRGDPDQWAPIEEARTLLDGQSELQYRAPVALAHAEALWLAGRNDAVDEATRDVLAQAEDRQAAPLVREVRALRRLAGIERTEPTRIPGPYDEALALLDTTNEADLRGALDELQKLGARPAVAIATRRLRERGVRKLPRGPRPHTAGNPGQLTRREGEVLTLVRQGDSNAEIAARLFLSERTVHHHVSAILRKLGVSSRTQAVTEASRRGIAT